MGDVHVSGHIHLHCTPRGGSQPPAAGATSKDVRALPLRCIQGAYSAPGLRKPQDLLIFTTVKSYYPIFCMKKLRSREDLFHREGTDMGFKPKSV